MRRLCGRVDDQLDVLAVFLKNLFELLLVTNIDQLVGITGEFFLKTVNVPAGRGVLTEKIFPEVIIDPNDFKLFAGKKPG